MRKRDILIEEIRAARSRISRRFGDNTGALLKHYQELDEKYSQRLLRNREAPVISADETPSSRTRR